MDRSGIAEGYDLIVLGSGAAGLSAAVTAAHHGLKVLVVEKEAHFGGASAISGGTIWIPGNRQASEAKLDASLEKARTYLIHMVGEGIDQTLVDAFLERGGEALAFLEENSELKFKVRPFSPDYHMELEGASDGGRALEVLEYDGGRLGDRFRELRKPPEGMLLFGGMMVNRADVQHFLNARRSWRSFKHCLGLLVRYAKDRLSHERGTRLVVGNALIARLARSALDLGVDLRTGLRVGRLIEENGQVCGVVVETAEGERPIRARAGVVLATGGFGASEDAGRWRPNTDASHRSMSPAGNIGDGLALASAAGASLGEGLVSNFYWTPVSVLTHEDGREEKFPHLVTDRAKPGIIAVNKYGRRFVNEADSYHRFVLAMQTDPEANSPCHLVCDSAALGAYGMGLARPAPVSNAALVKSGYLIEAQSIGELASRIGIDPGTLKETIERYNDEAALGADPEFGKGNSSYNRSMGDPNHRPNPCLAPIRQAPFYAIKLVTGDLGSARGVRTDANARVLDGGGWPIPGLYAAGNDMNSIMNGTYPGPGITLGPALTFGYLAALHAVKAAQVGADFKKTPCVGPGVYSTLFTFERTHRTPGASSGLNEGTCTMIYEMRTYTLKPTKMADWLALYKNHALAVQQEYLGKLVGFFTTEFGTTNQVVHIWAYESLDDRTARRSKMAADPRWAEFSAKNKELDAILELKSSILKPTDFSPLN